MVCTVCGIEKVRMESGRLTTQNSMVYIDQDGKRWNGYQCPQCVIKAHRRLRKTVPILFPTIKRSCETCEKPLPANRRFNHIECIAHIEHAYV